MSFEICFHVWDLARASLTEGMKMKALHKVQYPWIILIVAYLSSVACAQMHGAPPINSNEFWTSTTLMSTPNTNTNPPHMTESQIKSGNRTLARQSVEVLGPESRYQRYLDTETETVQESPTTSHSIVRTYRTDVNGQKILVRVTDENIQSAGTGELNVVRTISDRDLNGALQIVQYEVTETIKLGPNSRETKTIVYVPVATGIVAAQTVELQQSSPVARKKTPPEGWHEVEVRESTTKEDGSNRTSEERVLRRDSDGKLSPFSRTLSKETNVHGAKMNTVETYSLDLPGLARDGKLHLSERSTTIQRTDPGKIRTEQELEQLDPGDPNAGLKVTKKITEILVSGASGTEGTKTVQARNTSGGFTIVSVERRRSHQVTASEGDIEQAQSPK